MKHPARNELALLAGGDLPLWRRSRLGAHVHQCPQCRSEVEAFRRDREMAAASADTLPEDLDWESLAVEMTANIRVGLEAGECVGPVRTLDGRWRPHWSLGTALASAALLLIAGLLLNFPRDEAARVGRAVSAIFHGRGNGAAGQPNGWQAASAEGVVLEASPSGPSVNENGSAMKLLSPGASSAVTVSVSLQDSVGTRYVDSDSGQVTINKVYYEQ